MSEPNIPVTEDELHAFVDGELPAERLADVEAWLSAHPDDAAKVVAWRAMTQSIRARFDAVSDEPLPPRLDVERLARRPRRWIAAAIAASLAAFVVGGGAGWIARGAVAASGAGGSLAADALDAHRLYAVEVRHPVEVPGSERAHLVQWLSKRCGFDVRAPELAGSGLKLVGGRLLPGSDGPAAFLMYEGPTGDRFTLYSARAKTDAVQMRYSTMNGSGALAWAEGGVGYVVSGPASDRDRLAHVAKLVVADDQQAN